MSNTPATNAQMLRILEDGERINVETIYDCQAELITLRETLKTFIDKRDSLSEADREIWLKQTKCHP